MKVMSFLGLLILTACHFDDFQETERFFVLDQNEYLIGDTMKLTAIVSPLNESKDIRVFKNYKNIRIWFTLGNPKLGLVNAHWTKSTSNALTEGSINKISITQKDPLVIDYEVKITEDVDSIYLNIANINYKVSFDKKLVIDPDTKVRILGYCVPINSDYMDSCEDYFEVEEIRIKEKTTPQHGV